MSQQQTRPGQSPPTMEAARRLTAEATLEVAGPELCPRPKVSVTMCTFQHAAFVRDGLASVLEQVTDFPVEVLVADDGSTDGTVEVLREHQARHPDRVRLLLAKENLGQYTGSGHLNCMRSLWAARGEFVAVLDGDDAWSDPGKLAKQVECLEASPELSGCFHDTLVEFPDSSRPFREYGAKTRFSLHDMVAKASPYHWSSWMFRRDRLPEPPDEYLAIPSGDMVLFALVAARGPVARVPEVMNVYRKHGAGITTTAEHIGLTLVAHRIQLLECLAREIPQVAGKCRRLIWDYWLTFARLHRRETDEDLRAAGRARVAELFGDRGLRSMKVAQALDAVTLGPVEWLVGPLSRARPHRGS